MKSIAPCAAGFAIIVSVLVLAFSRASAALTIGQAASLPLPELRKEVFGEVGAMIVDADRSTRNDDPSKPQRYMAFYTRASYKHLHALQSAKTAGVF